MINNRTKIDFQVWLLKKYKNIKNYSDEDFLDYFYSSDLIIQKAYILEFFDMGFEYYVSPYFCHDLGIKNRWAGYDSKGLMTIDCATKDEAVIECIKELNKKYNAKI